MYAVLTDTTFGPHASLGHLLVGHAFELVYPASIHTAVRAAMILRWWGRSWLVLRARLL
jgi:hypothetical protein